MYALVLLLLGWLAPSRAPALIQVGELDIDARDVHVVGRLAYVADYSFGLRVLDVSDPEAPTMIGGLASPGAGYLSVDGDLAILSIFYPGRKVVIDISDPEHPIERGSFTDVQCQGRVTLVERTAYVGGFGLCVIDMARPSHPRKLAFLELPGGSDMVVVGDVAFVATASIAFPSLGSVGSLEVVDVSKPHAPAVLSRVALPTGAGGLALAGDVAWVSQGSALAAIDVSDPRAATLLATTSFDSDLHHDRMQIRGSIGYATDQGQGLHLIDLANPSEARLLGSLDTRGYAQGIALVGDIAFVASGELAVIDVSYPFAPIELSHHQTPAPALGLALSDGRAYLASSEWNEPGFLEVLDVSDPGEAVVLGARELPLRVSDVAVSGQTAFLVGDEFRTLDVSDPTSPALLGRLDAWSNRLQLVGSLVFTEHRKLDVSDPSAPVDLGFRPFWGIHFEVVDGRQYTAGSNFGLVVSDLESSEPLAMSPVPKPAERVEVEAGTAYLGLNDGTSFEGVGLGWLRVIDVSDPGLPVDRATVETPGAVYDIEVSGDLAFLAYRAYDSMGVVAIDVADPAQPRELGAFPTPGVPEDLEIANGLVHLADGRGGFRILDFGPEYRGARGPVPLLVDVDVAPGSRDRIKPKRRRVKAALLASQRVPAAEIDPSSLAFGASGAPTTGRLRFRDVNRDGLEDLVAEFALAGVGLGTGKVDACVQGSLRDGRRFVGCDDVVVRAR